jgi:hypothetical protein
MRWIEKNSLGMFNCFSHFPLRLTLAWDRLKKVQGKKKRDTAARDAAQQALGESADQADYDQAGEGDLLSSKDEDVIF